jgi:hypothetical protein
MKTMAESRPISVRAPKEVHDRIEAAAYRAFCTKSEWVLAALDEQLELDERAAGLSTVVPEIREEQAQPVFDPDRQQSSRMAMTTRRLPSMTKR